MKNLKFRKRISFLLVPLMVVYVFLPCISYAQISDTVKISPTTSVVYTPPPDTKTITYYYQGSTLMNSCDDNGYMSTYLDRTIRTIVNVNTQTVEDTQCLFTDGKNVISQTDSAGTDVTSTHQYNAFGEKENYNPNQMNSKPKTQNSELSIVESPFQYDDYNYDSESGLYYLNARYYSPTLMQFISMDSYDLANRYAYSDGNPIGNTDPTGHSALSTISNIFNNQIVRDIADGAGILSSIASFDALMFTTSIADLISSNVGNYSDKNYVEDGISAVNLLQFGNDVRRISGAVYRSDMSNFFKNKTKGTIFVDIDKNLILNQLKNRKGISGVFTEEDQFLLSTGAHDKYNEETMVYFNNRLGKKLLEWKKAGYKIRGLSTGKWNTAGFGQFAVKIGDNFSWDSWISSTHDSNGGRGLNGIWGKYKLSSNIKSDLTITSKFNYMKGHKGPKLLLDDEPYHRWGARLAGGYGVGAYTEKMLADLEKN